MPSSFERYARIPERISPAFTALDDRKIFLEDSLITPLAVLVKELMRKLMSDGHIKKLVHRLAIDAHALCYETSEWKTIEAGRRLQQKSQSPCETGMRSLAHNSRK